MESEVKKDLKEIRAFASTEVWYGDTLRWRVWGVGSGPPRLWRFIVASVYNDPPFGEPSIWRSIGQTILVGSAILTEITDRGLGLDRHKHLYCEFDFSSRRWSAANANPASAAAATFVLRVS